FRMIDTPHPREAASEYRCWPMLDFQSGIDDHEIGITHIIRGIDLQDSAKRQQFLYDYFDWEYPEVIHWGHVQVEGYGVPLSTSSIAELIADGDLDGWDDPRAPTLASLRRRGIRGDAIVEAMVQLGTSTSNVDLSMSTIYANNRERIDADADRYFYVREGERVPISGTDAVAHPPVHPEYDRGTREIPVDDAVLVESDDLPAVGERVWLKGLGPVRRTDEGFVGTDDDIEAVRSGELSVIHWAPADASIPVTLRTPDGDVSGRAEPGLADVDSDAVLQFERVGFARIDATDPEIVAYFAHP
ncbi:MAG: glutamate--tRNA ligase family protein, partial [Salinarchaeum sp.]